MTYFPYFGNNKSFFQNTETDTSTHLINAFHLARFQKNPIDSSKKSIKMLTLDPKMPHFFQFRHDKNFP